MGYYRSAKIDIKQKCIIIQVPEQLYEEIKDMVHYKHVTLRQFVTEALIEKMAKENKYK